MSDAASDALRHLKALVACPSVTPAEAGSLAYLEAELTRLGFAATRLTFSADGTPDVENLFATIGEGAPHLVFCGHTDVVPPGDGWSREPFAADVADGVLYGRGAVDMKGGIACFLAAAEQHLRRATGPSGTISLLVTCDEEGPAINGTAKLLAWALDAGHRFDAALVGEPTSQRQVGDAFKTGRRGSVSGVITVAGRQGHVAYPHLADNPVPGMVRALDALCGIVFDDGSDAFQPTNLEITSVETGNPVSNVIPASVEARFNVRFNDRWTPETVKERVVAAVAETGVAADFAWPSPPAACFLTRDDALIGTLSAAISAVTGIEPTPSTGGGTSDARFFRDVCPVVEFGPVGATMHQADERIAIADLRILTGVYAAFLERYFAREP